MSQDPKYPDTPDLLGAHVDFEKKLSSSIGWFPAYQTYQVVHLLPFIRNFLGGGDQYPAVTTVFTQAVNDYYDLLTELGCGRGRPAVRSARSLIEHAVNIIDVYTDPDSANRYMDHLSFEAEFVNENNLGLELLGRSEKRKIKAQRAHRYRRAKVAISKALETYGNSFRRSWSATNLRTRAVRYGLGHLYPAYRVCSLVLHGSAGGILGTAKSIDGKNVHRTGPALHLCPFAFIAGIEAMLAIIEAAGKQRPELGHVEARAAIEVMRQAWPDYARALEDLDRSIWPKRGPMHASAILAIPRSGNRRWYWHDPESSVLIEAYPPSDLEPRLEQYINEAEQEFLANPERYLVNNMRFMTIAFDEVVSVRPKLDVQPVSASAIMLRPEETRNMRILRKGDNPSW